jgi:predicted ribosome quality control (RQC) complex YloA/Tae2 family protein
LREQVEQEFKASFAKREQEISERFTKEVNTLVSELEKSSQAQSSLQKKISSLTTENTQLKQKRRVETIIIKKPDGTEETHIVDVTDTESISSKHERQISELTETHKEEIKQIETKHQEQIVAEQTKSQKRVDEISQELSKSKRTIEELEKSSKTVTTNVRNFGIGVGYTSDRNYSSEVSYQFWGPVYMQLSGDSDFKSDYLGRATLGIRF